MLNNNLRLMLRRYFNHKMPTPGAIALTFHKFYLFV